MKKFAKVLAIALVIGIIFTLTACGGGDALSGKWEGENDDGSKSTWTFNGGKCHWFADYGEGYTMDQDGTYDINEETGIVVISLELWDAPIEYAYTIDGDHLTLTSTNGYSPNYDLSKK